MCPSDQDYLNKHRRVWQQKPVLRRLYGEQFYARLLDHCAPGSRNLEIGSGPGFLQDFAPSVWRTDILYSPWIHCVTDAHHLPVAAGTLDNILGLDVLHHFNRPLFMLREAARALRPGGRLVLIEPWITPFSRFIYTYLHQEICDLSAQPWQETVDLFAPNKLAFEGNAAIPYLLVRHLQAGHDSLLPDLQLHTVWPFSSLTYLLSLGFKQGCLLPVSAYSALYRLEQFTQPLWRRAAALRAVIVWEKRGQTSPA